MRQRRPGLLACNLGYRGCDDEKPLRLLTCWGKQMAAASDGADHAGVSGVGFDLAPDAHDPDVNGPIKGLGVACIGELEQPFAGEDPLRVFGKCLEQAIFRCGQRMLVALGVAKRAYLHIEPLGAETNQIPDRRGAAPNGPVPAIRAARKAWQDSRPRRVQARPPDRSGSLSPSA